MSLYKKYFFLFFIVILILPTAHAQGEFVKGVAKAGVIIPAERSVSRALSNRVLRTYRQAKLAELKALRAPKLGAPTFTMLPHLDANPTTLYPQETFLTTDKQLNDYFLSRNNREYIAFLRNSRERVQSIKQHLEELEKGRQNVPQGKEINWAVSQIPNETSLLLLGETHYVPDIQKNVAQLLRELRDRYPNRPMVLFTEFLPEGSSSLFRVIDGYTHVLSVARDLLDIPVIGLEPSFVIENDNFEAVGATLTQAQDIWETYEGMRLRNNRWTTFINDYQQQLLQEHPEWKNPLFIVYAGSGHTEYGMPYSLADMFPKEKIFSISFSPAGRENAMGLVRYSTSTFDKYTHGHFAIENILLFKDPQLARLSGANIIIKRGTLHKSSNLIQY